MAVEVDKEVDIAVLVLEEDTEVDREVEWECSSLWWCMAPGKNSWACQSSIETRVYVEDRSTARETHAGRETHTRKSTRKHAVT